jgi:hypothetical protein
VGGVVCDLLSFDRLLEFEFGFDSISRVFESPFEPKAEINDSTVNHARDIHDQPKNYGKSKGACKKHMVLLIIARVRSTP